MTSEIFKKYFPDLTPRQLEQLDTLGKTVAEWNDKINVISRKDVANIDVNHILHSLAIAKFLQFVPGSAVIDLGTGGGFPGLPLAIMFPDVNFHLIDRVGKKLTVARDVAEKCGLSNVTFQHGDMGECKEKADFVVSRAVMPLADLVKASRKNILPGCRNAVPNGLIALKGGELQAEIAAVKAPVESIDISTFFEEPFFQTKKIVYTPI